MIAKLNHPVEACEARAALARVLASAEFKANRNSADFLRYTVEETLAGRGERIKGYAIATGALGRKPDFDSQSNSIVRVQAIRLRKLLDAYYAGAGAGDRVRIELPLGSYKPQFEKRPEASAPDVDDAVALEACAPSAPLLPDDRYRPWWRFAIAGVFVFVLVVAAVTIPRGRAPATAGAGGGQPYVSIRVDGLAANTEKLQQFTDALALELESRFSAFDNIRVRAREASSAAVGAEEYALAITPRDEGVGASEFVFRLWRTPSGLTVWTKSYSGVDIQAANARATIVGDVTVAVADLYGVIDNDMRQRMQTGEVPRDSRYGCELASLEASRLRSSATREKALACLEAGLKSNPGDPNETALLAILLVRGYLDASPGSNGRADLERAQILARTAYEAAPYRARSQYAYFLTRFYAGEFDEAFAAADKALNLNPYSATIGSSIGSAFVERGDYARGLRLLDQFARDDPAVPAPFLSALALAAYMQGDAEDLAKLAHRPAMSRSAMGILLRTIIGAREHAGRADVELCARQLLELFPGVAKDVPAWLARLALADGIEKKLLADLGTSGLLEALSAQMRNGPAPQTGELRAAETPR